MDPKRLYLPAWALIGFGLLTAASSIPPLTSVLSFFVDAAFFPLDGQQSGEAAPTRFIAAVGNHDGLGCHPACPRPWRRSAPGGVVGGFRLVHPGLDRLDPGRSPDECRLQSGLPRDLPGRGLAETRAGGGLDLTGLSGVQFDTGGVRTAPSASPAIRPPGPCSARRRNAGS